MGSHCINRLVSFARQRYAGESAEGADARVESEVIKGLFGWPRRNLVDRWPYLYEARREGVLRGRVDPRVIPVAEDYEYS